MHKDEVKAEITMSWGKHEEKNLFIDKNQKFIDKIREMSDSFSKIAYKVGNIK